MKTFKFTVEIKTGNNQGTHEFEQVGDTKENARVRLAAILNDRYGPNGYNIKN